MQGGVVGGICLLAFLLSVGRTEELAGIKEPEDPQNIEDLRRKEDSKELSDLKSSDDLKSELSLAVTESNSQENEGRSGAMAHSSAHSFGGSSISNAVALSNGGGSSSSSSAYSDSFGGSAQSKATAVAGFSSQAPPLLFNSELRPYKPPSSNFAQADAQAFSNSGNSYNQGLNAYPFSQSYPYDSESSSAQAQADTDSEYYPPVSLGLPNLNSYNQGINSNKALANSEHYQTIGAIETKGRADNRLYQSEPALKSNLSPYGQEKSFTQGQLYTDNELFIPGPNSPISNPYNQGLSAARVQAQADSESYRSIAEPNLIPFRLGSNFDNDLYQPEFLPSSALNSYGQEKKPVQAPDSESYQTLIEPFSIKSKFRNPESFSYPRDKTSSNPQGTNQVDSDSFEPTYYYDPKLRPYDPILKSNGFSSQNDIYQAIPIPNSNPSPYDPIMVPYIGPNSAKTQVSSQQQTFSKPDYNSYAAPRPYNQGLISGFSYGNGLNSLQWDKEAYQAIPFPDPNPSPYDSFMVPYKEPTPTQKESNLLTYESVLKPPNQDWNSAFGFSQAFPRGPKSNIGSSQVQNTYQPISIRDSSSLVYESNRPLYIQSRTEVETNPNKPNSTSLDSNSSSSYSSVRSGPESAQDDADSNENRKSKESNTDRDANAFNQYPPSGPYPQLYPSGADGVYADDKIQGASDAVYPISKGTNPYANDYPPELSPYQPTGYGKPDGQATSNVYTGGQSSPIAFDDAKSRVISPDEFVFLNKMPGGENSIQCTKENEFHHFWSQGLECLVCICLNEYGILTPVCASCSGCRNPPPKLANPIPRLPELITVRPASPPPENPEALHPTSEEPNPFSEPPEPIEPQPVPYVPPYPEPIGPIGAPMPVPEPTPETMPTSTPPTTTGGSCAPLPSGQPFTNPLHPCQICVCQESYQTGKRDVQIQCKDNPQCIAPADVTTLPPIPDVAVPIPLPMCEKFPEHVLFPHPTETCKLCKCAKHMSDNGETEQHITCYPHPDCVPKLEPVTEPVSYTSPPLPIPIEPFDVKPFPPSVPIPIEPLREPIGPVPLPEVVTVEPLPWPPVTTPTIVSTSVPTSPLTPRPGPLPGPSPHESCRPYPPNQTFQHPWDECQVCQCTESTAVGMVTVEVNCYTKPSCCIEPPESLNLGYTKPYTANNNANDDGQLVPVGVPSSAATSSTYRPLAGFPPYTPRAVIYPGSSQPTADLLGQYPPAPYTRIKQDEPYSNQPSAYPYQQNYLPGYVKPQYSDYPARLPAPNAPGYTQNTYGYPGNYQYNQGDAYPGPQGNYQPYDPRYQGLAAPNVYPPVYQRPNYDIPMYPSGQIMDGYPQQASAQGANGLTAAQAFARDQLLRSKPDLSEDDEDS